MNKAKKIFAGMLAGVMALSFAACSGGKTADKTDTTAAPAQKTDITVCLDWTPNTNHTGMFVAKEKGYYEAAGLNVSIVQPPDNSTATQLCSSNKAQFAVDAQGQFMFFRKEEFDRLMEKRFKNDDLKTDYTE